MALTLRSAGTHILTHFLSCLMLLFLFLFIVVISRCSEFCATYGVEKKTAYPVCQSEHAE